MAELSLTQAAALTGKSKSTLTRAIKSGRLTASRADGTFSLDPAELLRVYPDAQRNASCVVKRNDSDAVQQAEISKLRDDLEAARLAAAVAEALAEERARALEAAERSLSDLRRLLPPASPAAPVRRRWWPFR